MKAILILMIFLILGALIIINNNNLQMHKSEDVKTFSELSLNWMDKLYSSLQNITGNIIKETWLPE